MSEYGYFACFDCRQAMWLGKAVKRPDGSIEFYQVGSAEPNSQQSERTRALWKMMADHTGHRIKVFLESSPEYDEMTAGDKSQAFVDIGGDTKFDIPFATYLHDWPG